MLKNLNKLVDLDLKEVRVIKDEYDDKKQVLTLHIKGEKNIKKCPKCGSGKIKRYGQKYVIQKGVKHIFITSFVLVELDIYKRRYICKECSEKKGKTTTFIEPFLFLKNKSRNTLSFIKYILKDWKYLSVLELSRRFNVSDKLIWNIIKKLDCEGKLKENIKTLEKLKEIYLGIDEHSYSGHDYVLIITELKTGEVIGVLPKTTKQELKDWLNKLPPKIMAKIKGYSTDMHAGYGNTVKEVVGGRSLHTIDPAHLVFLGNRTVDQVRQMNDWMIEMGYFEKDRKIDVSTKRGLKRGRKPKKISKEELEKGGNKTEIELMARRKLFLKGEERLNDKQVYILNKLFKSSDPKQYVFEAWSVKELIREALQAKDITLIDKAISDAKLSEHYLVKKISKTLKKWYEGIKNYMELQITNACTEGKNNVAKLFKRMAFGYRNKDNYVKKLYYCL